jgi:hypothetical protein
MFVNFTWPRRVAAPLQCGEHSKRLLFLIFFIDLFIEFFSCIDLCQLNTLSFLHIMTH